jgi:hypothetical protein
MRTLLLALMIALLPIRGWLGDAMAVEMALHAMPAAAAAATVSMASAATEAHCQDAMEAMDADDGMGMQMAMSGHPTQDPQDHATHDGGGADHQGCGTCTACQVCHTVALGGMPLVDTMRLAPQAPPAAHTERFASAEPAQGLKPPIS